MSDDADLCARCGHRYDLHDTGFPVHCYGTASERCGCSGFVADDRGRADRGKAEAGR